MTKPDIPTVPGLYAAERFPLGTEDNFMPYFLTDEGVWYEVAEPGSGYDHYQLDRWQVEDLGRLDRLTTY